MACSAGWSSFAKVSAGWLAIHRTAALAAAHLRPMAAILRAQRNVFRLQFLFFVQSERRARRTGSPGHGIGCRLWLSRAE